MTCPCFSGKDYADCCALFHEGKQNPSPVELMRSRYCAYALGKTDYILKTTHPDHPEAAESDKLRRKQIEAFTQMTQFVGLEILDSQNSLPFSTVTFRAHLLQNGQDLSFTEKSEFGLHEGKWCYRRALSLN